MRSGRFGLCVLGVVLLTSVAPARGASARAPARPATRASLQGTVEAVLQNKLLAKGKMGVEIVRLGAEAGDDRVIYRHNEAMPLMPASNLKVLTTSSALDLLGPDFKFRTLLVQRGDDLILIGDGDPSFGDAELLRKVNWGTTTVFQDWAEQLKKAGRTQFRDVLVDDSVFDEVFIHPHWPADQEQSRYVAQVAGMALNANCVDFYVHPAETGRGVSFRTDPPTQYVKVHNNCVPGSGIPWLNRKLGTNEITLSGSVPARGEGPVSVTIHDPALFAATVLAETLGSAGIKVQGKVGRDRGVRAQLMARLADSGCILLAIHETSLAQVIARADKDSMNLYAESLCKRMGFAATGQSGTWSSGTAATAAFLKKVGAAEDQFKLDDGCGLSRDNAVSVDVMMKVLMYDFHSGHKQVFLDSLAVGGQDGTLEKRFHEPELNGRVFAKTGYIGGVSALSGYLWGKDDQWYAFSILMNGLPAGTNSTAKKLQESIVKAIRAE